MSINRYIRTPIGVYFLVMAVKRIFIKRTKPEWDAIEKRLKELGKADLSIYLRNSIGKLKEDLEKKKMFTEEKKLVKKQPKLSESQWNDLKELSIKMKKPISSIVNDYLIMPLLHQEVSVRQGSF